MDDISQLSESSAAMPHVSNSRASVRVQRITSHVTQTLPFSAEAVDGLLNLSASVYLELKPNTKVYALVCAYITSHGQVSSFRYDPDNVFDDGDLDEVSEPSLSTYTTLGLGVFPFAWKGHSLHALHQAVGQPVGTQVSVDLYTSLVLFAPRSEASILGQFCHELVLESERSQEGFVTIFEWSAQNEFWNTRVICTARPLHTVVLDQEVKDRLLEDMQEFLGPDARSWYKEHGIPYKRGYLFYGVPGTGKTSLIQALAAHFEHNLCYVHLTHPRLTDESLRAAINEAPNKSILVLEDVDAVFGKDREKFIKDSPLSFSGLLNALDGVGKADGQVFILTTNHRERLNPALIRNGRADVHIEFAHASDEQITLMFARFYPFTNPTMRQSFVGNLRSALAGRVVTTAALQHFFIMHRRSSASKALESTQDVVAELDLRADEQRMLEEELASKKEVTEVSE